MEIYIYIHITMKLRVHREFSKATSPGHKHPEQEAKQSHGVQLLKQTGQTARRSQGLGGGRGERPVFSALVGEVLWAA